MTEVIHTKIIETLKRKASSLFSKEDKTVIFDAVNYINDIVTRTTLLIKLYYLENLDDQNVIEISKDLIDLCFTIIKGKTLQIRQVKPKECNESLSDEDKTKNKKLTDNAEKKKKNDIEKLSLFSKLFTCYKKYFTPLEKSKDLSVSYILEYSNIQLLTCYKNNVDMHYDKYVKKYLLYYILQKLNYKTCYRIPKDIRKTAYQYQMFLLYETPIEDPKSLVYEINDSDLEILRNILCVSRPKDAFLEFHIINNHWKYLKRMVVINQLLETEFPDLESKKLYCPLVLCKSFIPSFIRIDTTGLLHLLMNQERLKKFVEDYKSFYDITLKIFFPLLLLYKNLLAFVRLLIKCKLLSAVYSRFDPTLMLCLLNGLPCHIQNSRIRIEQVQATKWVCIRLQQAS